MRRLMKISKDTLRFSEITAGSTAVSRRLMTAMFAVLICLAGTAFAQQESELELEEYRIVGKDTRSFEITGDRSSTVDFVVMSLPLPEEERSIEASQGLIANENRMWRDDSREMYIGAYGQADAFFGSRTPETIWGKGSYDAGAMAGTIDVDSRMSKENTITNRAPVRHDVEANAYFGNGPTHLSAHAGFGSEGEEVGGERFRGRDRETGRYSAGAALHRPVGTWDMTALLSIDGASYSDEDVPYDDDEFNSRGRLKARGDMGSMTVNADAGYEAYSLGNFDGSMFSGGADAVMLLFDSMSLGFGADLYVSAMPDEDAETKLYPKLSLDWAMGHSTALKARFAPEVRGYSHTDLYMMNGLTDMTPLLFESVPVKLDADFIWRLTDRLSVDALAGYCSSENTPVFTKTGKFFALVPKAEVDLSSFGFGLDYHRSVWSLDSSFTVNDASWNLAGEVPYVPAYDAVVSARWFGFGKWVVKGKMTFRGEHYTTFGTNDKEDAFMMLDCGVEREIKQKVTLYCDFRNLTDADGAWWTDDYQVPGIGFYAGLRAGY